MRVGVRVRVGRNRERERRSKVAKYGRGSEVITVKVKVNI
jgi:hypothetical protein